MAQDVVEPEHRVATVAFVKFEGVDQMMTETGPDGVAAALDDLVCAVQGAVDRAGVTFLATDVDKNGGKVILVTGVPTTQGDDEGRMSRAVGEIVGSEHALHVRAGIHRGHVFAGEVGSTRRATFTIIGDTVNLAARLMSAAPPGGIYATPEVLDRSRTEYASTALEPFRVKGKSQPVRAFSVGRAIGPRVERSSHVLPFRGRDDELDAVLATIDGARGGRGLGADRRRRDRSRQVAFDRRSPGVCGRRADPAVPCRAIGIVVALPMLPRSAADVARDRAR